MAQTTVPNSPDISVLDFKLTADLCEGNFFIDLSPSIFKGNGAQNVQGAKVKIVNPFDVEIKQYGTSYDILNNLFQIKIPKVNNNYQYGLFVVTIELTDSTAAKYYATHNIGICEPNPKDKTQRKGIINARLIGNCLNGILTVLIDEPPVYKGKPFESKIQTSTLTYPTGSIGTPLVTTLSAFSVPLYEGVHLLKSELCVTYNLGDNNYAKVPYSVSCKKNILCTIDLCCVYDKLSEINLQLGDNCSASKKENLIDVTLDALRLLKTIELGASCGEDVSDYIEQIEKLLNCECSCSANTGTPVVNSTPSRDIAITGCNVVKTTVGLTDSYQIENFDYEIKVNPVANFLTISAPVLTGCVKVQQLDFNVQALYAEIKIAATSKYSEYDFWASVVNGTLTGLPAKSLTCLGITSDQWDAKTFRGKILSMIDKFCGCCDGAKCDATIANNVTTINGKNTLLSWDLGTGTSEPFSVDIFIDNKFQNTVLTPSKSLLLIGFNDGIQHTYKILSHCSNGTAGNTLTGTFSFAGCPVILAPSLSSNSILNATCPFNLNTLVTPVAGLSIVWYNSIVADDIYIVPNPTAVTSGTYYAYQVDANKCSSPASRVTLSCQAASNCTEPLNLLVQKSNTAALITFSSPSNPAPSYLVKRRLQSTPDVAGSYVTIGSPVFNVSTSKYQISDTTAAANTLYVYKAESQCTDGGRPSAFYTFSSTTCPAVTLDSTTNEISYSFAPLGGDITKYQVILRDENNADLVVREILPPFASPLTGTFVGLDVNRVYKVGTVIFIGQYSNVCNFETISTKTIVTTTGNLSITQERAFPPAHGFNSRDAFLIELDGVQILSGEIDEMQTIQSNSNLIPFTSKVLKLTLLNISGTSNSNFILQASYNNIPASSINGFMASWNAVNTISNGYIDISFMTDVTQTIVP